MVIALISFAYTFVGTFIIRRAWLDYNSLLETSRLVKDSERAKLAYDWSMHYKYPRIYKKPRYSLSALDSVDESAAAHYRVNAYRRTLGAFVWPIYLAGFVVSDYRKSKMLEQNYLIKQSSERLKKAKEWSDSLEKARLEAQEAIDSVSSS